MAQPSITAVRMVLDGMRFPAHRWQLIAQAELYGADIVTREGLQRLPARLYLSCEDVTATLLANG